MNLNVLKLFLKDKTKLGKNDLFILEASSAPPPNLNLSFYGVLFSEGNPGGSQVKFPWKGPFHDASKSHVPE